jgi:predicted O-linked N-acetylglucosamine transferase (SPINDLY family)
MKAGKASLDRLEQAHGLHRRGRVKEAESLYRKLISGNSRHHRALSSLGVVLCETGRIPEAIQYLERAIAVEANPKYLTNLGAAYRLQGRLDMAAEAFGRILEIDPNYADARLNLALILMDVGIYSEAMGLLNEAVRVGPDNPRLRGAFSWLLLRLHRPKESLVHATRGVELAPDSATAHQRLGDALDANGDKTGAIASYRRAVQLDPSNHRAHSDAIIAMLSHPEYDAQKLFLAAREWARLHAEPLRRHIRPLANDKDPQRRLRIGYCSPDFRTHAIQQFLVPLFEHHDKTAFEIFLYSSTHLPDEATQWYRDFAGDHFRDIQFIDDIQAAELVRNDGIDILVDLALHGVGSRLRLFACRPAPVQVSWLGYMGTTGLDTIDYRITDPFVDPPGADLSVYTETCLRLPETLWCYAPLISDLVEGSLPALSTGHITFGCQNTVRKLHSGVLALWARVLREVVGSRLFLYAEEHARPDVRATFVREGIDPDRIEFGGRVSRIDYLRRYQNIDIGLDTFPFTGATTTLDAAWMGVPVVTLTGSSSLQRAGACIAANLGLAELIAESEDQFVQSAVALTHDLDRLGKLRSELRSRLETSPLGNAPRFAGNLEAAFRSVWRRYCTTPESERQ